MTNRHIKKSLTTKQIGFENIEILSDNEVEVFVEDREKPGVADQEETDALSDKVSEALGWGGYQTGYGAWVLQESYAVDDTDYCDVSNPIHY